MRPPAHIPGADHRVIPDGTGGAARRFLCVLLLAAIPGLLFGAEPLHRWAADHPSLAAPALAWQRLTSRAGLGTQYAAVRTGLRRIEATR